MQRKCDIKKIVQILIWIGIIAFCFIHRKELSAEGIARFTPKNPWLAAVVMLALFALKSLSVVIYSGLLYAANGILFPLPVAIILNLTGTVIMVSLPYLIGRKEGTSAVDAIRAKYPKAEAIHDLRAKNDFLFSFLVRMVRLPSDVASLYMGAVHVEYKKYLLGSLLGLLPHTITYPMMGMNIRDIRSPQFLISLCAEIAYILVTSAVYTLYRKKKKADR
ncbi:MAG: TVP38/TMEM64 family protein [Faecousia sp.]